MNYFILYTALFISSILGGNHSNDIKKEADYKVFVKQNNRILMLERGSFPLEASPFSLDLRFTEPMGVYVNASISPDSYQAAKAGKNLKEIPGFSGKVHKMNDQNEEKTLVLDKKESSYLYFANEDDHSFFSVHPTKKNIKCERLIAKFISPNTGKETATTNLHQKIYIVIVYKKKEPKSGKEKEMKRSYFALDFK